MAREPFLGSQLSLRSAVEAFHLASAMMFAFSLSELQTVTVTQRILGTVLQRNAHVHRQSSIVLIEINSARRTVFCTSSVVQSQPEAPVGVDGDEDDCQGVSVLFV